MIISHLVVVADDSTNYVNLLLVILLELGDGVDNISSNDLEVQSSRQQTG